MRTAKHAGLAVLLVASLTACTAPASVASAEMATLSIDGPLEGGTGAVLRHQPGDSSPALVDADRSGVHLVAADGQAVGHLTCPQLGAAVGEHLEVPADPPSRRIVPLGGTTTALVGLGGDTGVCGSAEPALVVVDLGASAPRVVGRVTLASGPHAVATHPDGQRAVVALQELVERRGQLVFIDLSDPSQPTTAAPMAMANGVVTDDLTFAADGSRLFVTAASHALVLDTSKPDAPTVIGRLADPLVRNYWRIQTVVIDDPLLGPRELFLVRARVDGLACPIGMVHVYDITDELFWEPAMIVDVDVPDALVSMRSAGPLITCAEPVLRLASANRLISIGFSDGRLPLRDRVPQPGRRTLARVVAVDQLPYDTTEAYRSTLTRCTLQRLA